MGAKGVFLGFLGLIVLQVVLSSPAAAGRTTSAFGDLSGLIARVVDPTVPAFGATPTASSASSPAAIAPGQTPVTPAPRIFA
jgi:hypothetical protein